MRSGLLEDAAPLRSRRDSWVAVLVLALTAPGVARADHASTHLRYEGVDPCASPDELRAAVAARLGYDPFVDRSDVGTVSVRVRRVDSGLEGTFERQDASGRRIGTPATIASAKRDCTELTSALAIGIAIAIDPLSLTREVPVTAPAPLPRLPPAVSSPPGPPPSTSAPRARVEVEPATSTPIRFVVGAGPALVLEALPGATGGGVAFAGFSRGSFELDVEGAFDLPASTTAGAGGSIQASLVLGTVAPCFHYGLALGCASLSLGDLHGHGMGFSNSFQGDTFYAAAGIRGGVELPLGPAFGLRLLAVVQVPLRPTDLKANDSTAWSTPPVALSLAPLLVGHFF